MNPRPPSPGRRQALGLVVGLGAAIAARRAPGMPGASAALLSRAVPSSGERIPVIGLGTYRSFDIGSGESERGPALEVLRRFHEGGARLLDSSPMYGRAESVIGELARQLGLGAQLFYATKVWTRGERQGVAQMEASYRRMGVERMDLMQVHNLLDVDTHLATLRRWKEEGRLRYLGVTHYTESAYDALERVMRRGRLDFVQLNYSLAERAAEQRLLPLAQDLGVAVIVNRPFANGRLFGRVRGEPLPAWAQEFGARSWAQLFLKFVLGHPAVTCAIPATRNPAHMADNLDAGRGALPEATARRRIAALAEGW